MDGRRKPALGTGVFHGWRGELEVNWVMRFERG
jgi:hypothetical protein